MPAVIWTYNNWCRHTGACKENKIIMYDLDVWTLTLNLVEGFNRNFFDQDQRLF